MYRRPPSYQAAIRVRRFARRGPPLSPTPIMSLPLQAAGISAWRRATERKLKLPVTNLPPDLLQNQAVAALLRIT
jgi:hypothetical protein